MATVLVADDDVSLRELLRLNLELEGHVVTVAEDGAAALAEWRRLSPDVLVLDMMMPGTSGTDVLEALAASLDRPWPCVVAFSASANHLAVAWSLGAQRTVLKNGDLDEVLAAVAECAAYRRSHG